MPIQQLLLSYEMLEEKLTNQNATFHWLKKFHEIVCLGIEGEVKLDDLISFCSLTSLFKIYETIQVLIFPPKSCVSF